MAAQSNRGLQTSLKMRYSRWPKITWVMSQIHPDPCGSSTVPMFSRDIFPGTLCTVTSSCSTAPPRWVISAALKSHCPQGIAKELAFPDAAIRSRKTPRWLINVHLGCVTVLRLRPVPRSQYVARTIHKVITSGWVTSATVPLCHPLQDKDMHLGANCAIATG